MKGMRVKTKLMVGGERYNTKRTIAKWPCAVHAKGVDSNLIRCRWVQSFVYIAVCIYFLG